MASPSRAIHRDPAHLTIGRIAHRMYRRYLWAMAYYPMVVLLAIVLIAIRLTDASKGLQWLVLPAVVALGLGVWQAFERTRRKGASGATAATPWTPLIWMFVIGAAYALAHDRFGHRMESQLIEWNRWRDVQSATNSLERWQPVAVRATLEEPIRLRRATHPRGARTIEEDASDDMSSDAPIAWQSLTRVTIDRIRSGSQWRETRLVAAVTIDEKLRGYYPGDTVEIYGQWRLPPEPSNPGQFDQRRRFAELGITVQLKAESQRQVQRAGTQSVWRLDRWLAIVSERALDAIDRYVILGQAPMTAALVLGQREQADWQLQEEMLATGTIHILSISGMHIEMVAFSLLALGYLVRLPRGWLLLGTSVFCVLYALLCGANPPVARATWMLLGGCVARWFGWSFSSLNILALAGLLILTQRTSIAFEVGTQLSFLTVAVLILTIPILQQRQSPLERLIESKQTPWQAFCKWLLQVMWESIRSSFWVCFISAPLVWHAFHIVSPIAIVLNLVLWLPMLIALLSGLILVVAFWLPPVAWLMGILCGGSLAFMAGVVKVAERVPGGHFWSAAPPMWWMMVFYGLALAIAWWRGTRREGARRWLLGILGGWFAFGVALEPSMQWLALQTRPASDRTLSVTWIDVGHGTSAVLQLPSGEVWVYDAGRLGDHERSYYPIVQALWGMGISRLDTLVLSHADSDHYNAMEGVRQRFSPTRFITTQSVLEHPSESVQQLLRSMERDGLRIDRWGRGARHVDAPGTVLSVLHPSKENEGRRRVSDNAKSLCVLIEHAGRSILLPGDLEPPGTEQLTSLPRRRVDALMAPHHGSLSARLERLVDWCHPETIVVSGSWRIVTPRVIGSYSKSGNALWITARDHAIRLEVSGDGTMRWLHWNEGGWLPLPDADSPRE